MLTLLTKQSKQTVSEAGERHQEMPSVSTLSYSPSILCQSKPCLGRMKSCKEDRKSIIAMNRRLMILISIIIVVIKAVSSIGLE